MSCFVFVWSFASLFLNRYSGFGFPFRVCFVLILLLFVCFRL